MSILKIEKHNEVYEFKDGNIIIYKGSCQKKGSATIITLENAYHDEILNLSYTPKSGFRLFRVDIPNEYVIQKDGEAGILKISEHHYEWAHAKIYYMFECNEENQHLRILMRSLMDNLAYVDQEEITLLSGLYSAEICAFYIVYKESKEHSFTDEKIFHHLWAGISQ